MSHVIAVDDANFEAEVIAHKGPVLVEFYATWCPHCQRMESVVAEAAELYKGKVKICAVDVDKSPVSSQANDISGIPGFVFFKFGHKQNQTSGEMELEELTTQLDALL